ncbi:MAG: hypothetical protein J0L77_03780 [Alphaproteobacteria bacterium]|nr:hypothetical protein [Alphaproteobacteria bacterium]
MNPSRRNLLPMIAVGLCAAGTFASASAQETKTTLENNEAFFAALKERFAVHINVVNLHTLEQFNDQVTFHCGDIERVAQRINDLDKNNPDMDQSISLLLRRRFYDSQTPYRNEIYLRSQDGKPESMETTDILRGIMEEAFSMECTLLEIYSNLYQKKISEISNPSPEASARLPGLECHIS